MAKVWFVRRSNRLVAIGSGPAYDLTFAEVQWPLDVGVNRFYGGPRPDIENDADAFISSLADMVLVEVEPRDVAVEGSSYQVGFYSSPYSPLTVEARLGKPWREAGINK